jgi:predicted TIM-barrel fold metal-dependent hydrolase
MCDDFGKWAEDRPIIKRHSDRRQNSILSIFQIRGVNDFSASLAAHYPHRLSPFRGIDPRLTSDMAAHMDRLLDELKIRAIKIDPPHQLFNVNDYLFTT